MPDKTAALYRGLQRLRQPDRQDHELHPADSGQSRPDGSVLTDGSRLPREESRSRASSNPDRIRCRPVKTRTGKARRTFLPGCSLCSVPREIYHFLQRFPKYRRKRLAPALRPAQDALAGSPAQTVLFRRVGLQNLRQGRCDLFSGARPSIPRPKRAMRRRNDLPRSPRREATFLLEVQEQKGYRRRG